MPCLLYSRIYWVDLNQYDILFTVSFVYIFFRLIQLELMGKTWISPEWLEIIDQDHSNKKLSTKVILSSFLLHLTLELSLAERFNDVRLKPTIQYWKSSMKSLWKGSEQPLLNSDSISQARHSTLSLWYNCCFPGIENCVTEISMIPGDRKIPLICLK